MNENFQAINCRRCGALVWEGISWAGFARKLDTPRLTIEEEIVAILKGRKTYELYRTRVSFEAIERNVNRIKWARPDKDLAVLADHLCSGNHLFQVEPPHYWQKPATYIVTEEVPF
jgi:hypothetical protein